MTLKKSRLLIIGGSDAGISASLRIKEIDPKANVTVMATDAYPNFSIYGLPFYLKRAIWLIFSGLLLIFNTVTCVYASDPTPESLLKLPVPGMVTMIDLGAKKCIPCKMMAPIMEKMEKKYEGKAAIVFIDVWEHREQARRFGIRAIPTQIFYDGTGKEIYRHVGFMAEKDIVDMLKKLGVEP
jgi:thioredoxin 1